MNGVMNMNSREDEEGTGSQQSRGTVYLEVGWLIGCATKPGLRGWGRREPQQCFKKRKVRIWQLLGYRIEGSTDHREAVCQKPEGWERRTRPGGGEGEPSGHPVYGQPPAGVNLQAVAQTQSLMGAQLLR